MYRLMPGCWEFLNPARVWVRMVKIFQQVRAEELPSRPKRKNTRLLRTRVLDDWLIWQNTGYDATWGENPCRCSGGGAGGGCEGTGLLWRLPWATGGARAVSLISLKMYIWAQVEGSDVDKRAWNSGFNSGMGKRAWNSKILISIYAVLQSIIKLLTVVWVLLKAGLEQWAKKI